MKTVLASQSVTIPEGGEFEIKLFAEFVEIASIR